MIQYGHYVYLITYLLTHLLIPCSRVLLEKIAGLQLVEKIPAFYGTRRFITAVTSARHLSLSSIQSINPNPHFLKIHLNIILPSMPGSPMSSPSFRLPHQNPLHAYHLPHTRYTLRPTHSSRFYHPNSIEWWVRNIKPYPANVENMVSS